MPDRLIITCEKTKKCIVIPQGGVALIFILVDLGGVNYFLCTGAIACNNL